MPLVAVVADDLTGAADTGVAFRQAGVGTAVGWQLSLLRSSYDVVALDLGTRGSSGPTAAERTAEAVAAARSEGVRTLYKKVDSLLRGSPGEEVRAALDAWGAGAFAVVAPAFPAAGRTTVDGDQLVRGERIDSLPRLLLAAGVSACVGTDLVAARAAGYRAAVCDASTDADLRRIAQAGAALGRDVVWVGTAGLAYQLPAVLGLAPSAAHVVESVRPVLTVVGSMATQSREQLDRLGARVSLDELGTLLGAGTSAAVAVDAPTGAEDAGLVERLAGDLARQAPRIGGLVATGGETASAVLRAFGVTSLELVGEVEPGMPLSVASGAWSGPVVTKAGAFGDADSLVRAVEMLEGDR